MTVDLSHLDPRLAEAVRRARESHPVTVARADDRDAWPAEASEAIREALRDGSFRAAVADIEADSPDLVLE